MLRRRPTATEVTEAVVLPRLAATLAVLLALAAATALADPPGSIAFALVWVLAACLCGYVHRSTLRRPIALVPVAVSVAAGLLLDGDREDAMLFAVAGPLALGGTLLLGTMASRSHRDRRQRESLSAAVRAQILESGSRDGGKLSSPMWQVLRATHDASNALSTALINAEMLRKATDARQRGERAAIDEERTASDLTEQLERLRVLVEQAREIGHSDRDLVESPEVVAPLPVAREVVRELRVRFPDVELRADATQPMEGVVVSGGSTSLRRILENLVTNACRGNGRRGARCVEVSVESAPSVGSVAIRVADDGPGFTGEQLARPIRGFEASSTGGTGLGLYTAERLARASGGSVARENRSGAGARVTVFLKEGVRAEVAWPGSDIVHAGGEPRTR